MGMSKRWIWDRKRRLYLDAFGDALSKRELVKGLDEYIESIKEGMAVKVADYTAGRISISQLFSFLSDEVTAMHGAAGSIAYGGLNQMDAEKFDRIDARIQSELSYLSQFQADVQAASGEQLSTEGIVNRAGLYSEAAYSEWINQTVERERDNGVTMGRRICESDGASCDECVEAATEEFIPLDEIPEFGSLQCLHNCRCDLELSIEGQEFTTSDIFQGVVGGQDAFGGSVTIQ
jgi:hypothetical protein